MARRTTPRETSRMPAEDQAAPVHRSPSMLVTYVDRCPSCSCTSLRDEGTSRPLPDSVGCGRSCRCHTPMYGVRALQAGLAADAARFRFWRRSRGHENGVAAVR